MHTMENYPKGDVFEAFVYETLTRELNSGRLGWISNYCRIYRNKGYLSRDRGSDIAVDISIELTLPGADHWSMLWVWECKDYSTSVPASDIEEFSAKLAQIAGANVKGGVATTCPLQRSALKYAHSRGLSVVRILSGGQVDWFVYGPRRIFDRDVVRSVTSALAQPTIASSCGSFFGTVDDHYFLSWAALLLHVLGRELGKNDVKAMGTTSHGRLLQLILDLDGRLFSGEGYTRLTDGAIAIDSEFASPEEQASVMEHERTHRSDIRTTHYGNLVQLIAQARRFSEILAPEERSLLASIEHALAIESSRLCFEAHATFNQRVILPWISEPDWVSALGNGSDLLYAEAYALGVQVLWPFLSRIRAPQWLVLALSDVILSLPLKVNWYSEWGSPQRALALFRRLTAEDHPSGRLRRLARTLKLMEGSELRSIEGFCREVESNFDGVYRDGASRVEVETVQIPRFGTLAVQVSRSGTVVSQFLNATLNTYLRSVLREHGFEYADSHTVPDISVLVDSWNEKLFDRKAVLSFGRETAISAQALKIMSQPIAKKRAVDPIQPEALSELARRIMQSNPSAEWILRLYQVALEDGLQISSDKLLPRGTWYCVAAVRYKDVGIGESVFAVSPEVQKLCRFSQHYFTARSASELIGVLPDCLANCIWLLPSPYDDDYFGKPMLESEINDVHARVLSVATADSLVRTVLAQNSVEGVLGTVRCDTPRRCAYDIRGQLWTLWQLDAHRSYVYVTPKSEEWNSWWLSCFKAAGVEPILAEIPGAGCILDWLGSGEGF